MQTIVKSHRSIIVLNGSMPDKRALELVHTNVPVIVADGAAQKIEILRIKPTYIIGDGDSFNEHQYGSRLIKIYDQDTTDFEKCIQFAKQADLLPALVLGINGGEIDHILGNTQALVKHAQGCDLFFLDTYTKQDTVGFKLGFSVSDFPVHLNMQPGRIISLVAFNDAVISTQGLEWELDNFKLSIDGFLGVRNRSKGHEVMVHCKLGKVLAIMDV